MTTCFGDSCSFGLPSMFFVNDYQVVLSFFFFFFFFFFDNVWRNEVRIYPWLLVFRLNFSFPICRVGQDVVSHCVSSRSLYSHVLFKLTQAIPRSTDTESYYVKKHNSFNESQAVLSRLLAMYFVIPSLSLKDKKRLYKLVCI